MTLTTSYAPPASDRDLGLLIVLLGGACTGFSGIFVKVSEVGLIATGAWRMAFAALVLLPFAAASGPRAFGWRGSPLLLLAGLFFAIDMSFYHWSLGLTSIAHSTLIVNLAPLVALIAGMLMFGERLGPAKLIALFASLGGAVLMTATRWDDGSTVAGNTLAAIGMFGYAFYLIVVKQARTRHDTIRIMLWSSASAAALMFVVAAIAGEQIVPRTFEGWAVVLALGLVSHVLGQGLVAYGMRTTPVGLASILLLIQPVVAAIAAWAIFDERLTLLEGIGAATVLAGLALASRTRN